MIDPLVVWYESYGVGAVLVVVFAAALALPLPASLLLITAGALAEHSRAELAPLLLAGIGAAVAGDQASYLIGRALREGTGRRLPVRRLQVAFHLTGARGMWGVFLSRWLFAPVGPAVNYAAGIVGLPVSRFLVATLSGEVIWVVGLTGLGAAFADHLHRVRTVATGAPWLAVACAAVVLLAVARRRSRRGGPSARAEHETPNPPAPPRPAPTDP